MWSTEFDFPSCVDLSGLVTELKVTSEALDGILKAADMNQDHVISFGEYFKLLTTPLLRDFSESIRYGFRGKARDQGEAKIPSLAQMKRTKAHRLEREGVDEYQVPQVTSWACTYLFCQ